MWSLFLLLLHVLTALPALLHRWAGKRLEARARRRASLKARGKLHHVKPSRAITSYS